MWPTIAGESTGTNARRRRLNPKNLLDFKIPVPSREKQLALREVTQRFQSIKKHLGRRAELLKSFRPSYIEHLFRDLDELTILPAEASNAIAVHALI